MAPRTISTALSRSVASLACLTAMSSACASLPAAAPTCAPEARLSLPSWVEGKPRVASESRALAAPPKVSLGVASGEPTRRAFVGRAIDLDVERADIHDVCRLLAEVGHVNIVVGDDVTGAVTVRMTHVPWDQVLDVVARAKGYHVEREGNVVTVLAR